VNPEDIDLSGGTPYYDSDDPRAKIVRAILSRQPQPQVQTVGGIGGGGSLGGFGAGLGDGFADGGGGGFQSQPQFSQPQFSQPSFNQPQPQPQQPPTPQPVPFNNQVPLPPEDPRSFERRFPDFSEPFNDRFPDPRVFAPTQNDPFDARSPAPNDPSVFLPPTNVPGFTGDPVPNRESANYFGADYPAAVNFTQQAPQPPSGGYPNTTGDNYPNFPVVDTLTAEDRSIPFDQFDYSGGTPYYEGPSGRSGGRGNRHQVE
jgi:hypothetical protein